MEVKLKVRNSVDQNTMVEFIILIDFYFPIELISNIPIIPTFSYVTKIAFEACLQLSAIRVAVETADEILGGKVKAAHTWLQKFEYLSQFLNETNNIESSQIIQVLIASMRPLKVAQPSSKMMLK